MHKIIDISKIGRNDPCPCGSGKKFKHCHLGREDELLVKEMKTMEDDASEKITSLPEVAYGRSRKIADAIDIEGLTGNTDIEDIRFIDFAAYVGLESFDKGHLRSKHYEGAGLIVNPKKTERTDPRNIYIAITPDMSDSILIHELAHVLDFLGGSRLMPGSTYQLSLKTRIPLEHLDHTKEFGDWLDYLKDRFNIELDAEDRIISFLNGHNMLLEAADIRIGDAKRLTAKSEKMVRFLREHKEEIDQLIRNRPGYVGVGDKKGEE